MHQTKMNVTATVLTTEMITAASYLGAVGTGITCPAFFRADDNNIYIVKMAQRKQDSFFLISEYLASAIGRLTAMPFPNSEIIYLPPKIFPTRFPTHYHFASQFIPDTFYPDRTSLEQVANLHELSGVILFDYFFHNGDRAGNYHNLLCHKIDGQNYFWAIDHSHLFRSLHWTPQKLPQLINDIRSYCHGIYAALISNNIIADSLPHYLDLFQNVQLNSWEHILTQIPDEWLQNTDKKELHHQLMEFFKQRQKLLPVIYRKICSDMNLTAPTC